MFNVYMLLVRSVFKHVRLTDLNGLMLSVMFCDISQPDVRFVSFRYMLRLIVVVLVVSFVMKPKCNVTLNVKSRVTL